MKTKIVALSLFIAIALGFIVTTSQSALAVTKKVFNKDFVVVKGFGNEQTYIGGDGAGSDVQMGSFNPSLMRVGLWNVPNGEHMDLFVRQLFQVSSRESKEDITSLSTEEALRTLQELNPVRYKYKADNSGEEHLGFIAEDVPELVATSGHKQLSPMDFSAVLVKAVQEQQRMLEEQKALTAKMAQEIERLNQQIGSLNKGY